MNILVLNPGGNSLKIELIRCDPKQRHAFKGTKLLSVTIEGIEKKPALSQYEHKKLVSSDPIAADNYAQAPESFLHWHEKHASANLPGLEQMDAVAVRVVHGGPDFDRPTVINTDVERKIIELENLAPLHNKSSIEILGPMQQKLPETLIYGVFDTAFHRTIPDYASSYAIPRVWLAKITIYLQISQMRGEPNLT
jgi:acetate kinase